MSNNYVLGVSAFYHDSAACILLNGEIIAAAQEERFTRKKHDSSFPEHAIKFCLDYAQIDLSQIRTVAFYEKPLLKFERVLENFLAIAPKGIPAFVKYMPVWLKQKVFFRKYLNDQLMGLNQGDTAHLKVTFCEHHLSHAAWAYFTSPFNESAILTIDGVGEWTTTAIYKAKGGVIESVQEQSYPHSLGLLYSAFTQFLGFRVNDGEYKMMGLAPYGNKESEIYRNAREKIESTLVSVYPDGSIRLNLKYFGFLEGKRMTASKLWSELFLMPERSENNDLTQAHCDFALAAQDFTEQVILLLAKEAKKVTGLNNLCIAGGVGYNCAANGVLIKESIFENIHIPPAVGDSGSAVGAALFTNAMQEEGFVKHETELKNNISFLGPQSSNTEIRAYLNANTQKFKAFDNFEALCDQTCDLLKEGAVVGWMQGRMEFGARALGARSILGDPRLPEIQKLINQKIKFRESFRPFAVILLEEDLEQFFSLKVASPYMGIISEILPELQKPKPDNYESLSIREKCDWINSNFPGISHVDYSCRVQTVDEKSNNRLYRLLKAYKAKSGNSLLINTSFNVKDQPIVCSHKEAYDCFLNTDMDALVMEDSLILKPSEA
ncbi:MAG: carbamoyltransferase [Roseivirga sp.]|jgi:carbamoyltransferase